MEVKPGKGVNWLDNKSREKQFRSILYELEGNPDIQKMKQYSQHKVSNTFTHSHNVAVYAYYLAERLKWEVDMRALVMGAMLHDYYLYDARKSSIGGYRHGIGHPLTALANADKIFELSSRTKNIITSHMWPLTFLHLPKCKEAVLVNIADKYCAFMEMGRGIVHIEQVMGKM